MLTSRSSRSQSRLQQQPERLNDRQQQQSSGSREFQPRQIQQGDGERSHQVGGGSYESRRDFNHHVETFGNKSDSQGDFQSSRPTCLSEAMALAKAEREANARRTSIG